MVVDSPSGYIYLFDFDPTATRSEKMKTIVERFVHLVPKILKQSVMFDHLMVREEEPLQYSWVVDGVPRQDTS